MQHLLELTLEWHKSVARMLGEPMKMTRSPKILLVLSLTFGLIAFFGDGSVPLASSGPSHSTHFVSDKGPHISLDETGCYVCHANADQQCGEDAPFFRNVEDPEGPAQNLDDTSVCDPCHSAGGMTDGVAMAKLNWDLGVYEPGGTTLTSGKEMWCISCHDSGISVCDGVSAPDISGDNTTYGYYVNGHRSKLCSDCHDLTVTHMDGEARTYAFDSAYYAPGESGVAYAAGYRLKSMGVDDPPGGYNEGVPLMIPTSFGTTFGYVGQDIMDNAFRLCFSCHDSAEVFDDNAEDGLDTNFKSAMPDPPLQHAYSTGDSNQHIQHTVNQTMQLWDSDWDIGTSQGIGEGNDSIVSCSSCHNVHGAAGVEGSTNEPMIRDGSLAGRTGFGFSYVVEDVGIGGYPMVTSDGASLPISVGAVFRNGNVLCSAPICHMPSPPGPTTTSYDATYSGAGTYLEYYRAVGTFSCSDCHAYGTEASHPTHADSTGKGVDIGCFDCHDSQGHVNNSVDFPGGDLSATNACDQCHSTGGAFGGVAMAKDNWVDGIYEEDGATFQSGKDHWCAGCHDDVPANSEAGGTGIWAPNVMGDGTYGYHISGHGQSSAALTCDVCHDLTGPHIDGNPRTYEADESFWVIGDGKLAVINSYNDGYRLNPGLEVPTPPGGSPEKAALCVNCHMSVMGTATNFAHLDNNLHVDHMNVTQCWAWDSDADGTGGSACQYGDSGVSCITCHNVHGSRMDVGGTFYPNPVMVRHGELTDTEPGLNFRWYTEGYGGQYGGDLTPDLMASLSGALWCMPPTCADVPCHSNSPYYNRTPIDFFGRGIVIDDFDSYMNDTGLQGNWTNTEDAKAARLEPDAGGLPTGGPDGSQCMRVRIAWTQTASAYGTSKRSYDPYIDLRAVNAMSFHVYVKNTAKIERVVVRLKKYPEDTYCEATVLTSSLQDEVWEPVSFLRADFDDDSWAKVSEIQFQIHEYDPGQSYAVNVYFDDVRFQP
jgi:hypothetical protein